MTIEGVEHVDISVQLKDKTRHAHQDLEKRIVSLIKESRSDSDYLQLLYFFYGYFGGLEINLKNILTAEWLPDIANRRKTTLLETDIYSMGGSLPEKASAERLPEIKNHLQAFGALYVMEGSTLGGPHIANMLQKKLGISPRSLHFFTGYGAETGAMWASFKILLDKLTTEPTDELIIITAAEETFSRFSQWIDHNT